MPAPSELEELLAGAYPDQWPAVLQQLDRFQLCNGERPSILTWSVQPGGVLVVEVRVREALSIRDAGGWSRFPLRSDRDPELASWRPYR